MRLTNQADLEEAFDKLTALDPRLASIRSQCAPIAIRQRPEGLEGLLGIIIAQQVSVASAKAISARFKEAFPQLTARHLSKASDDDLRACSLSRPKIKTIRKLVEAIDDGFDLLALAEKSAEEAHADLCSLHGIGPWTAEIYLLFCLGHRDIFPAGDLALQISLASVLGLKEKPDAKETARHVAALWAPERSAAAHLLWAHYRHLKQGRDGVL